MLGGTSNGYEMYQPGQPPLVLKLVFSKEETSFLFGFNGVLISQLQQHTGADVTMSFGDCIDYVIRVAGTIDMVCHASHLVCRKLFDYRDKICNLGSRPFSIRLAVAGNQCGSIIGRNGSKVNEIRDRTSASISVFQECLPNSNERPVEILGDGESCLQCLFLICKVLLDNPPKSDTIPYVPVMWENVVREAFRGDEFGIPDNKWRPVFLCGNRAYVLDGTVARLAPPEMLRKELSKSTLGGHVAGTLLHGLTPNKHTPDHMNPLALMAAISNSNRNGGNQVRMSREMWVRADLMRQVLMQSQGSILGEIHRMSGAQVHLGNLSDVAPSGDLLVTLSGTEDSILLAQFLVQSNLDMACKSLKGQAHFVNNQPEGGPKISGLWKEDDSNVTPSSDNQENFAPVDGELFSRGWRER